MGCRNRSGCGSSDRCRRILNRRSSHAYVRNGCRNKYVDRGGHSDLDEHNDKPDDNHRCDYDDNHYFRYYDDDHSLDWKFFDWNGGIRYELYRQQLELLSSESDSIMPE